MPNRVRRARLALVALGAFLLPGCADTNAPAPTPEEVLLTVNAGGNTLTVAPIDPPGDVVEIPLGGRDSRPNGVAARGEIALVPLGPGDAVALVDLRLRRLIDRIPLPAGSGATGVAVINDSIAYVGNPNLNSVSRVNYLALTTQEVPAGSHPDGVIFTRGRVFILNANVDGAGTPLGSSWITVLDPVTNAPAAGGDSIALTGSGGASFATTAGDGLLYVVSRGSSGLPEGRLSAVDPLARMELASFGGLGTRPGDLASDGDARVFISSATEGLLEFDTDSNAVVRGAGHGVDIPLNSGVAIDSRGRVYAVEEGDCAAGHGVAHVLDLDLDEVGRIGLGRCPGPSRVVRITQGQQGAGEETPP